MSDFERLFHNHTQDWVCFPSSARILIRVMWKSAHNALRFCLPHRVASPWPHFPRGTKRSERLNALATSLTL